MKKSSASSKKFAIAIAAMIIILLFAYVNPARPPAANALAENNAAVPTAVPTIISDGPAQPTSCITSTEKRTVRGSSMEGLFSDGDVVSVQIGYYGCNAPERNDVSLVHFAGDPNPLIKIIKAVPGDSFSLLQANCGWNVIVNGRALLNSDGAKYCIGYSGYRMLSLYVQSYNGIIPQDAYLVLGNLVGGSTDSTRFGLTSKSSLLGKVEIPAKIT